MKIGLYGGSFDPVHSEHVRLAAAAKEALGLDKVIVIPSYVAPHKSGGANVSPEDRAEMCRIAFREPWAEVSTFELEAGGTSYTYLTCEAFREREPDAELFFLVGADMLEDFFTWRNPERILASVTLAACGRGNRAPQELSDRFFERFGKRFVSVPFCGEEISSTRLRVGLAFRGATEVDLKGLDDAVRSYIGERGLYRYENAFEALMLESESRRAHSYRVALLACTHARKFHIAEGKALVSAMMHDCAKTLPPDSPLLSGFSAPEAPAPVLHQFAGAYLAEHAFGVTDEDILDAIRYHSTGRENMTPLGKLIYLADLLEEGRSFEGVEELRSLLGSDLDVCMEASLFHQLEYLKSRGKEVDSLTQRAYEWYKSRK